MFKIKKLLENFIETQKQIGESIEGLREDLKPKYDEIGISSKKIALYGTKIDTINDIISADMFNKNETLDTINKEYDYRENYKECKKKNEDLLHLIEKYFRYNDKYEIIDLFATINEEYAVIKVEDKDERQN